MTFRHLMQHRKQLIFTHSALEDFPKFSEEMLIKFGSMVRMKHLEVEVEYFSSTLSQVIGIQKMEYQTKLSSTKLLTHLLIVICTTLRIGQMLWKLMEGLFPTMQETILNVKILQNHMWYGWRLDMRRAHSDQEKSPSGIITCATALKFSTNSVKI